MNLHEYQSKQIFRDHGIPVPEGLVIREGKQLEEAIEKVGFPMVLKAQIHAGGRGKAGGIMRVESKAEAKSILEKMLGSRLVTRQSGPEGKPVNAVLAEEVLEAESELYLAAVLDRSSAGIALIASSKGGMEIEEIAREAPSSIVKVIIDPLIGIQPFQARGLAYRLGLPSDLVQQASNIATSVANIFMRYDCSLVEINPLVKARDGGLIALDAKINIDDNSLFRQKAVAEMRDVTQEDPVEVEALNYNLSYIKLGGNIGCMVNGAGLAMATMDVVKLFGAMPANFLDVGGGVSEEGVKNALKIIARDEKVKGILINIFGGIARCDVIAAGILGALRDVELKVPMVVRLRGTNEEIGRRMLQDSGIDMVFADLMEEAARKIVELVGGQEH